MITPRSLVELSFYWHARILHTSLSLGIFTALSNGEMTANEVAARLSLNPRAVELLLNALVGLKLLKKNKDRYVNTKISDRFLVEGRDDYLYIIRHLGGMWGTWEKLEKTVRTGKPPEEPAGEEDSLRNFILGMHNIASACAPILARKMRLSGYKTLLDLGGGPGTYSIYFCKTNPGLAATVFDLPETLPIAKEVISRYRMEDKIRLVAGDYNVHEIDGKFDAVLLSNIIHAEGFEENTAIIRKLFNALNLRGKIILQDFILNEDRTIPSQASIFAINMLVNTDKGRTYTFNEISGWLKEAGFRNIKRLKITLPNNGTIITAEK
ncbi:MAG: SAM-dependent methyltransferase [Candidatus Omnitrophica bacterium]|nr:SAM-dependent methyltransferase [Candidatus Omnitrophota bacterium]